MGAKHSQQHSRSAELDITDIAADKLPTNRTSATHTTALSSATSSPALTSLSSKHSKLTPQAWSAPQQSRYMQSTERAEDAVTEWKAEQEEKQTDDDEQRTKGGQAAAAEDLFGKYKSAAGSAGNDGSGGSGGGAVAKRSGIVSGVKAASSVGRRQQQSQQQTTTTGLGALLEDEEGVDDSAVSAVHGTADSTLQADCRTRAHSLLGGTAHILSFSATVCCVSSVELLAQGGCAFHHCGCRRQR